MKNWNRTGKIKAILLVIFFIPNLIVPIPAQSQQPVILFLFPLLFGSFAIPFITLVNKLFGDRIIAKPTWNDNPLKIKTPLSAFDFYAWFFLTVGVSMILGTAIKFHSFNNFGLTSISFSVGIFIGIQLTLKWIKTNAEK